VAAVSRAIDAGGRRLGIAAELLAFFWARKLWWLIPMVSVRLALGLVLVVAHSSAIAPFVYTRF
jgi:hypothetical protein